MRLPQGGDSFPIRVDVIVDDREKSEITDDWTPRQGGEIDILVHHEEAQKWVDTAADAWLSWTRSVHTPDEDPG